LGHRVPLSLSLCSSPTRPPPTAPLFPYTTLFRSVRRQHHLRHERRVPLRRGAPGRRRESDEAVADGCGGLRRTRRERHPSSVVLDRKSTRLNSSHVSISYAVFCLKKTSTSL